MRSGGDSCLLTLRANVLTFYDIYGGDWFDASSVFELYGCLLGDSI